jgi:hypothetical protein
MKTTIAALQYIATAAGVSLFCLIPLLAIAGPNGSTKKIVFIQLAITAIACAFSWFIFIRQRQLDEEEKIANEKQAKLELEKQLAQKKLTEERQRQQWIEYWSLFDRVHADNMTGGEFEQFADTLFTRMGHVVTKPYVDGGADRILDGRVVVQFKRSKGIIGPIAVRDAIGGKIFHGLPDAMVVTNRMFTAGAIEAARRANVKLIDGNALGRLCVQFQGKPIPEYSEEAYKRIFGGF